MGPKSKIIPRSTGKVIVDHLDDWTKNNPNKFLVGHARDEMKKFIDDELVSIGHFSHSQENIANMSREECESVLGTTVDHMPNIQDKGWSKEEVDDVLRQLVLDDRLKFLEKQVSRRLLSVRPIVQEQRGKRKLGELATNHPSQVDKRVSNAKWNPINNPISSQKLKEQRREEAMAALLRNPALGDKKVLSDEECVAIATTILDAPRPELDNVSIRAAATNLQSCGYIGTTKRSREVEDLRWAIERGANQQHLGRWTGAVNRPVIQRVLADGTTTPFTMKQARDILQFKSTTVYESQVKINGCRIEDAMQKQIDHLPLPFRLHRHVAKGNMQQSDDELNDPFYLHQVFVTYSSYADVMKNPAMKVVVVP